VTVAVSVLKQPPVIQLILSFCFKIVVKNFLFIKTKNEHSIMRYINTAGTGNIAATIRTGQCTALNKLSKANYSSDITSCSLFHT